VIADFDGVSRGCDGYRLDVTTETPAPPAAVETPAASGTTTIRIATTTKARLLAHADEGESIGDVVTRLATQSPTNTEVTRSRDRVAAYLRTHLVPDFGDRDEETPGEQLWQELAQLQYPGDPDTTEATAVVLDHTALGAFVAGRRLLAQLLFTQSHRHRRRIFAPTQAIYTATVQQPALARHIERLETVEAVAFDMAATLVVGDQVASNVTAAVAHVVHAARPSKAWPTGRPVVTVVPQMYGPYKLALRPLPEA